MHGTSNSGGESAVTRRTGPWHCQGNVEGTVVGDQQSSPITRRTIAKGIAWSVPAFALATAAPALAQSPLVDITPTGDACKYGGGSQSGVKHAYLFPVYIKNNSNEPVKITTVSGLVEWDNGGPQGDTEGGDPEFWDAPPHAGGQQIPEETIVLSPGDGGTFYFVVDEVGRSPQSAGTVTLTVLITGEDSGRSYTVPVSANFARTNPCDSSEPTAESTTSEHVGGDRDANAPAKTTEGEPGTGSEAESVEDPPSTESEESSQPAATEDSGEAAVEDEAPGS